MKKIACIAIKDFANIMTHWVSCINNHSVDYEAHIVCMDAHHFDYDEKHTFDLNECKKERGNQAKEFLKSADYIILSEEIGIKKTGLLKTLNALEGKLGKNFFKSTKAYKEKNFSLYHTGSVFRNNNRKFEFYRRFQRSFSLYFYGYDLYRLCEYTGNNAVVPPATFDAIDKITKANLIDRWSSETLQFFHAPSNTKTKGTVMIREAFEKIQKKHPNIELVIPERLLTQQELRKIRLKSHFYIDQFIPDIGGFGVSAMDAVHDGCITFASLNNVTNEATQCAAKYHGDDYLPFIDLGMHMDDFISSVDKVLALPKEKLIELAWNSLQYYGNNFSSKRVAEKLISALEGKRIVL